MLSLISFTTMEDELTKTGSQFTHPQTKAKLPLSGGTYMVYWPHETTVSQWPLSFSCGSCFIPVTLHYALQVHREPWIIISHVLSQPYLSVCMFASTHKNHMNIQRKCMYRWPHKLNRQSEKHSDKHKYAQRATFNQYEKQDLQNPYRHLLSHICAHKHHMYTLWSFD